MLVRGGHVPQQRLRLPQVLGVEFVEGLRLLRGLLDRRVLGRDLLRHVALQLIAPHVDVGDHLLYAAVQRVKLLRHGLVEDAVGVVEVANDSVRNVQLCAAPVGPRGSVTDVSLRSKAHRHKWVVLVDALHVAPAGDQHIARAAPELGGQLWVNGAASNHILPILVDAWHRRRAGLQRCTGALRWLPPAVDYAAASTGACGGGRGDGRRRGGRERRPLLPIEAKA